MSDCRPDPRDSGIRDRPDASLAELRERLLRTVSLRLDRRVRGRVDPSDVIQEAFVEACKRIGEFERQPVVPFFVWLRFLTVQKIGQVHRRELGTKSRDARRDVSLDHGGGAGASSAVLVAQLLGESSGPGQAASRAERKLRLQEALGRIGTDDREVLTLRHFEQLSNHQVAHVLGITESAACRRYGRAMQRLREVLVGMLGELSDWAP